MKLFYQIAHSLKKLIPDSIWNSGKKIYWKYLLKKYLREGRPFNPGETSKAKARRAKEGFFDKFTLGKGLDIGYGGDPVVPGVDVWDFEHGDAQYLKGIEKNKYDFVYSSHTLEHMVDPSVALKNWFDAVKKGGYLIIYLPHRDLYEKKKTLPSRFNMDHKSFFLPDRDEEPHTVGVIPLIQRSLSGYEIIYVRECSEGHTITDPEKHSDGEFSIEAVIRKL